MRGTGEFIPTSYREVPPSAHICSRLYKASGYNLRLVQKQLGHSSVFTTQVYADVFDTNVDKALANLDLEEE